MQLVDFCTTVFQSILKVGMAEDVVITFRWSIWKCNRDNLTLLNHSIGTFQFFFAAQAAYIVFTDDKEFVERYLQVPVQVYNYTDVPNYQYLDDHSTWKKWVPACRWTSKDENVEIRVDYDMFLVGDPLELKWFCSPDNTTKQFMVTAEAQEAQWPYGNFAHQLRKSAMSINAGLLGQYIDADLTNSLHEQYAWWSQNVNASDIKYHDEQGAVAKALELHIECNQVFLLPLERYCIISPFNDTHHIDVNEIVLLHATCPDHPAFYQFLNRISQFSGIRI